MGQCSSELTVEEKKSLDNEKQSSAKVDLALSDEHKKDSLVHKLLLLGAGESGKSTLFKQIVTIYGNGYSDSEKLEYRTFLHNNTIESMQTLIVQSDALEQTVGKTKISDKLLASKNYVMNLRTETPLTEEAAPHFTALWNDPGIQNTFAHAAMFQLLDSAPYLFERIEETTKSSYIPTFQDILRTRVRTTGIIEYAFSIANNNFRMFDVGGQRNERKKWIHCFEHVTAVIFVASISCYNQKLYEDENVNRMHEALNVFEEICNSKWFVDTAMILFLNKHDLFLEKIKNVPLTVCFPEYTGANTPEDALAFIQEQFESKNHTADKQIFPHVTTATSTDNIKHVFNSVKEIVVRKSLNEAGLYR